MPYTWRQFSGDRLCGTFAEGWRFRLFDDSHLPSKFWYLFDSMQHQFGCRRSSWFIFQILVLREWPTIGDHGRPWQIMDVTIPEVRRRIVPVCASALIILWEIILSPRVFPAYNKDNKFWHNSCIVFDLIMLPSQNSLLGAYFHQSHHSIFVVIQYVFPVIIVLPLDSHRWDLSIGTTFIPIL